MKINIRIPIKAVLAAAIATSLPVTQSVQAAPFVKADNTTALDVDGSYTITGVPGSSDTIVVDSTLTAARTVNAGSGIDVLGLDFQASQNQNFTIGGSGSLTIGADGILKNTPNLVSIAADITLSAAQTWEVNTGVLRFSSAITTGGNALGITGAGTLEVRGTNTYGSDITISTGTVLSNQASTVTTLGGANTFTTLNFARGKIIGATLGNFGDASNFGSGGVSTAINLGSNTTDAGILEYTGLTDTSNRTFNRGGNNDTAATAIIEVSTAGETLTLTGNLTSTSSAINGSWQFGGAGNLTLQGVVSDQGNTGLTSIVKADSGTLTLEAVNTYEGTTTITGGSLLVNNATGSGLGSGNVIVNTGTLGGTGEFTGAVSVNAGGTLSPGASIETLGSGSLTFNSGSTFEYEADSGVATSVGADLQKVSGGLDLNGTVTLTLADLNLTPVAFGIGTTFTLINYTGAWNNGLFTYNSNVVADGGTFTDGLNLWEIDYNATSGGLNFSGEYVTGNFVNITTVVPEPTTALLLAAGGLVTMVFRRRRNR